MDNKNNVSTSVSVGEKANYDKLFPKEITPQSNTSQLSIDPKYMSDRVDLTGIKDPAVIERMLMEDQFKNRDKVRYSNLNKYIDNSSQYYDRINKGSSPNNVLFLKERADKALSKVSKSFE
jgi:hypothetical protein